MYDWTTVLYTWNEHIVNKLYFNKNNPPDKPSKIKKNHVHTLIKIPCWEKCRHPNLQWLITLLQ